MPSKVTSALEILQQEGPVPLAQKTSLFLARQTSAGRQILYKKSKEQIRERMDAEEGLEDILDTVLDVKPGYPPYRVFTMQLRDEIKTLTNLVEKERPKSVLEIGTAKGGSFYIWSRHLDSVNRLISLDLPGGRFGGGYDEQKTEIFREFSPSKNMDFVRTDSHQSATYDEVSDLVDDGIDFLFIDGDHTYEGVKQDFEMYSELVSEGGIIALHDIATHPNDEEVVKRRRQNVEDIEERHLSWGEGHSDCNVDQFWTELVEEYDTEEIISHPKQTWAGIGVIRL
ncbi:class I SAM-dependent methyltransferase (plasmid) [Halolamina sp. CBA1230]|uniref:class I SAM-dependent methyltransferase n=1 Tax=Halolamina sp. CBA1230 TaxID=1853690 RepID=UPI0009A1DA52|nr:class I SAM-dependent methyltransferase [Halolamina sp. CBA1230]QKY22030.1 class I SAM-dependent methyltransferase [Halolamina sp. CBA1230]